MSAANPFFALALACLIVHELDAVRHAEWRVLPLLARLPSDAGFVVFTALHVPLLWAIFAALLGGNQVLAVWIDGFCIIHLGLHLLLRNHPLITFRGWLSWGLIGGAALAGALALAHV